VDKIAIIHNGRFGYELIIDNNHFVFQGSNFAEYLELVFLKLGYAVRSTGDGNLNYNEKTD
jgi:hypothetical protein